ncbi:MAG: MFS transporter [Candidatus Sigynarchaeota archaeon]
MRAVITGRPRQNPIGTSTQSGLFTTIALHSFCMASAAQLTAMGIPIFVLRNWGSDLLSGASLSIPSLFYIIFTLLFGKVSGRIGRRRSMLVSLVANLAIFVCFFSLVLLGPMTGTSWMLPLILACRGGEGIAQSLFWPNLEARISDIAESNSGNEEDFSKLTGKGVSFFNLGWNVGLLSSAFEFWLIMAVNNLGLVMFVAIIAQAMNLSMYRFYTDIEVPTCRTSQQASKKRDGATGAHLEPIDQRKSWMPAGLGLMLVFFYGFSLNWIYATTTNFCFATGIVPLLGILETLRLAMQTITSSWFKHEAKVKLFTIEATAVAVVLLVIAMGLSASGSNYLLMLFWFPLLGTVMGTMYAEALNMVELSGVPEKKGSLMGLFESAGAMGNFSGPFLAGFITQTTLVQPYPTAYFIGAATFTCLIVAITTITATMYKKKKAI